MNEQREAGHREQQRRRRRLLLAFALVFFVLLAWLLIRFTSPGPASFGENENGLSADNPIDGFLLDKIDATTLTPFGDAYLLRLNPGRLSVLNLQGAEEYSFAIRTESPLVTTTGDYALVYERDGYTYYLATPSGVIYEGQTQDPIVEGQVSPGGSVALILDAPETSGLLRVMNPDGRHNFDYRLRDRLRSGQLIRANFAQNEEIIDLSILNTDGAIPRPLIHRFDLETAQLMEIHTIDADEILPIVAQGVGGDLLAIGPRSVYRLEGDLMSPWLEATTIRAALPCQNGAAMIASDTMDGLSRLYYLKFSDDAKQLAELPSVTIGKAPQHLVTRNNYVAVSDDTTVYLVNVNTMATERVNLGSTIYALSIDDRGRVLVVTQDRVIRL